MSTCRRQIADRVNNGVAWKTPSCICSCQLCIKSEVCCSTVGRCSDGWKLRWKINSFLSEISVCWSCTEKITIKIERAFSVILRASPAICHSFQQSPQRQKKIFVEKQSAEIAVPLRWSWFQFSILGRKLRRIAGEAHNMIENALYILIVIFSIQLQQTEISERKLFIFHHGHAVTGDDLWWLGNNGILTETGPAGLKFFKTFSSII